MSGQTRKLPLRALSSSENTQPKSAQDKIPYRRSSSMKNVLWHDHGGTMSLGNALALYNLTETDIRKADPPIELRWRSIHGKTQAIVKCSDMTRLKEQLVGEPPGNTGKLPPGKLDPGRRSWAEEYTKRCSSKVQKKRGKTTREKQATSLQTQKIDRKEDEVQRNELLKLRDAKKKQLCKKWLVVLSVSNGDIADSIEGLYLTSENAKKEWFLNDADLARLPTTGKTKKRLNHKVCDLIRLSESKLATNETNDSRFGALKYKLQGYPERLRQYARFLQDRVAHEMENLPNDMLQEIRVQVRASLEKKVAEKHAKVKAAEEELKKHQRRIVAFEFGENSNAGRKAAKLRPPSDKENRQPLQSISRPRREFGRNNW